MTSKPVSEQDQQPDRTEAGATTLPAPRTSCPGLTIVIPCHNEEQVLPETAKRLGVLLDELTTKKMVGKIGRAHV